MIVAHLDLDAFFAAVEELENPELRTKPLIVGGDPHGRGVVATANYEARKFGIHSAMSCAEALRRCPHAVFVRPRHSLYREYSQARLGDRARRRAHGRADRARRGLSRRRRGRGRLPRGAEGRRGGADRRARRDQPHLFARRLHVEGRREDRQRPSQARRSRRRPGRQPRRRSSRRSTCGGCPASGRRRSSVSSPAASRRSARSQRSRDEDLSSLLPGSVGRVLRDRARGIDPRGLELQTERISISVENTFERDLTDRAQLHAELRRMAEQVAAHLQKTRPHRSHGLDEGALYRLLDPQPLDVAARRHRRRRADRRARLRPARPRARRPARRAHVSSASASPGSRATASSRSSESPALCGSSRPPSR